MIDDGDFSAEASGISSEQIMTWFSPALYDAGEELGR
jgi:hypothetical protein